MDQVVHGSIHALGDTDDERDMLTYVKQSYPRLDDIAVKVVTAYQAKNSKDTEYQADLPVGGCKVYNPTSVLYVSGGGTTTRVHRLYKMQADGSLLFLAIIVNDCFTKSKFDNLYGSAMKVVGAKVSVTEIVPSCALQELMEGIPILTQADVAEERAG
ncbi:hypothetical protein SUGI_0599110 [Cryptomeria japonica]|nr:hypothetical protein SUGI_0599110 [Cryptomeria japonica]